MVPTIVKINFFALCLMLALMVGVVIGQHQRLTDGHSSAENAVAKKEAFVEPSVSAKLFMQAPIVCGFSLVLILFSMVLYFVHNNAPAGSSLEDWVGMGWMALFALIGIVIFCFVRGGFWRANEFLDHGMQGVLDGP